MATTTWDYEGYWNAVLGANRSAGDVVGEFDLASATERQLDEWLGTAEAEAWSAGGGRQADLPGEWSTHHARALAELVAAVEVAS